MREAVTSYNNKSPRSLDCQSILLSLSSLHDSRSPGNVKGLLVVEAAPESLKKDVVAVGGLGAVDALKLDDCFKHLGDGEVALGIVVSTAGIFTFVDVHGHELHRVSYEAGL